MGTYMRVVMQGVVVVVAMMSLVGCEGLGFVDPPVVTVQQVVVAQQSDQGVRLEVQLIVENPNEVPLPLVDSDYAVRVGDSVEHESSDALHRTLPKGPASEETVAGRQVLRLPLAFESSRADWVGQAYQVRGQLSYEPPGEVRQMFIEAGWPLPTVEFNGSGQIQP